MLGDQVMWFAQTVGHQFSFGAEQLYGVGTSKPQEVQQLRVSPQITLDRFALTSQGITTLQAGQNLNYLLAGQVYDFHVYDGGVTPNVVLFTYVGCKCQNFSESVPANAPIRDSYSFLAMDVLDSNGDSILETGENALQIAGGVLGAAAAGNGAIGLTP